VLRLLGSALAAVDGSKKDTARALQEAIVSIARDAAQAAVVADRAPADATRLIADADHALLTDDPAKAFALLVRAAG
jgi:beta-glucosidase